MKQLSINELQEKYDLELDKVISEIKKNKCKKVLLQFPEGLKPYAQTITDEIESKTQAKCFIWMGTCFGACDLPLETERLGMDLIIQFGHSKWNYKAKEIQEI
jgi:2-(3-amino-3-carboxypropyl)histidine synthase